MSIFDLKMCVSLKRRQKTSKKRFPLDKFPNAYFWSQNVRLFKKTSKDV